MVEYLSIFYLVELLVIAEFHAKGSIVIEIVYQFLFTALVYFCKTLFSLVISVHKDYVNVSCFLGLILS